MDPWDSQPSLFSSCTSMKEPVFKNKLKGTRGTQSRLTSMCAHVHAHAYTHTHKFKEQKLAEFKEEVDESALIGGTSFFHFQYG